MFSSCTGEPHLFHSECVQGHFDSQQSGNNQRNFYKCMICQKQYGTRTGEMPPGRMSWHQDYRTQLQGFDRNTCPFVIVIQYSFQSGYLPNGTRYSGTSRTSFLPGTPEGIECLGLLILSF